MTESQSQENWMEKSEERKPVNQVQAESRPVWPGLSGSSQSWLVPCALLTLSTFAWMKRRGW